LDRSRQAYEDAVLNLEEYVKDPRRVKLEWNTLELVRGEAKNAGSLGRRAAVALEKYNRL